MSLTDDRANDAPYDESEDVNRCEECETALDRDGYCPECEPCPHDDIDHGICCNCEADLTDQLTAAAYDMAKDEWKYGA